MELISVIVPIYKVEAYLDRCVQSIVNQTYTNLEIILVDDGSPDQCPQMCDTWAKRDARVRVVHKENGGLSDARNAGLSIAGGEYIAFVDSDDAVKPDYLSSLYQVMQQENADIAECGVLLVREDGEVLRERSCEEECLAMDRIEALRRLVLEQGVFQTVWNKLYRRSVIEGIPFEKGKYHEDEFWTYRVFERAERIAVICRPMYRYLQRSASIMGDGYSLKRLDGLEARAQRMRDLQKYSELAELTRQQFALDCMYHWQCACRHLSGEERACAVRRIRTQLKETDPVRWNKLTLKTKYKVWYALFRKVPDYVVKMRNCIGIGVDP